VKIYGQIFTMSLERENLSMEQSVDTVFHLLVWL